MAVYERWMPDAAVVSLTTQARLTPDKAKNVWSVVAGPAAACLATALRIGWHIYSFDRVTIGSCHEFDLRIEPPVVFTDECR